MRTACITVLVCLGLAGCVSSGPHWGARTSWVPSGARVHRAFVRAATDPETWVPAAAAAVFAIGDLDERVSDWASRETPIFGSIENADRWSIRLRNVNRFAAPATFLLTDSGSLGQGALANKLRGSLVGASAIAASELTVESLKTQVGRTRPNRANDKSFPSGRAAESAVHGQVARSNLDWIRMPTQARDAAKAALTTTTWLAAWARVEADAHFPSDSLAGLAIGNFFARFAHETFLGHPCDWRVACRRRPAGNGIGIHLGLDR